MRSSRTLAKLFLPLLLASGCATPPLAPVIVRSPADSAAASSASGLKQARISYRARPASAGATKLASYTASPSQEGTARVLRIEYPHPSGDRELARASLVTLGDATGGAVQEKRGWLARVRRWTDRSLPGLTIDDRTGVAKSLTISKSEVDALLRTIVAEEVLTAGAAGAARLDIEVNGAARSRSTAPLPPLEELAKRIKAEGQLLPATDPVVQDRLAELAPSDDRFYENLQASLLAE